MGVLGCYGGWGCSGNCMVVRVVDVIGVGCVVGIIYVMGVVGLWVL